METIKDLNDMLVFARVVEHGGLSAAAPTVGLQTSTLSRRLSDLESELGVRLLHRTTRRISLTDAGQRFYAHCQAVLSQAAAAREEIDHARASPRGLVRLNCPVSMLQGLVAPILLKFLADNPDVRLDVKSLNRPVDVVDEGFDLAIRIRIPPLEDSGLVVRRLAVNTMGMVASAKLIARHGGAPETLADLAGWPTVSMPHAGEPFQWVFQGPSGERLPFTHEPRFITEDVLTLRDAALNDLGVTYLPLAFVADDLRDARLVQLLPSLSLPQGIIHIVFASRRGMVPAVRELIDRIAEGFSDFAALEKGAALPD